jgi:UDP-glucuronate decarboxylase
MKVLVTGAAGFLGSHLVDRLLQNGHEVSGLDNMVSGDLSNLEHLVDNSRFNFQMGDVRDPIRARFDIIFNFACPASPAAYQKHPLDTLTTSVMGAYNLMGFARTNKCIIVHASTSEVYGDPVVHPQPESYWGNVNPIGKRSCYDEGKRAAETLLTDAKRTLGVDARIVRIFNTYGPRMKENDGRAVSNFVTQALNNDPITIYGNGNQTRSFCYVDDLIGGVLKVADLKRLGGSTPMNLGNPQETTVKKLAEKIVELTGSKSVLVYKQLPGDDPRRRKPDISKAIKTIGFRARVPLEEGLQKTIDYFRSRR